jgi:hypothetical protein
MTIKVRRRELKKTRAHVHYMFTHDGEEYEDKAIFPLKEYETWSFQEERQRLVGIVMRKRSELNKKKKAPEPEPEPEPEEETETEE